MFNKYFIALSFVFMGSYSFLHAQNDMQMLSVPSTTYSHSYISGDISNTIQRITIYDTNQNKFYNQIDDFVYIRAGISFLKNYTFSLNMGYHFNKDARNLPWMYDYAYSLVRNKWRPNTFAYGFLNYDQNKYSNSFKQFTEAFMRSIFFVKYYLPSPKKINNWLRIDSTSSLIAYVQITYSIKYMDQNMQTIGGFFEGKPIAQFCAQYIFWKKLYVSFTLNSYLAHKTRVPWDSDFYYGFGLNNFEHLTVRFSYGNYINNKFPWRTNVAPFTDFWNGMFNVSLNYRFDM